MIKNTLRQLKTPPQIQPMPALLVYQLFRLHQRHDLMITRIGPHIQELETAHKRRCGESLTLHDHLDHILNWNTAQNLCVCYELDYPKLGVHYKMQDTNQVLLNHNLHCLGFQLEHYSSSIAIYKPHALPPSAKLDNLLLLDE